jgi:ATP-binding cassette subfamily B protein
LNKKIILHIEEASMSIPKPYKSVSSFIWHFVKSHRMMFFFIAFVSLAWSIDMTVWPYLLGVVIDIFTKHELHRDHAWMALKAPILLGVFLWMVIETSFRIQRFLLAKALPKIEANIRMHMFDHIQHHSPNYFNQHFSGSLANKITDMTGQVSILLESLLTMIIPGFVGIILALLFFARVNILFSAIYIVWLVTHFYICLAFSKKCSLYEEIHGEVRSSLIGKIVDSLTNNFAVNIFYRFAHEKSHIAQFQKIEQEKNYAAKRYTAIMYIFLGVFSFLIALIGINGFMLHLWLQGQMSTGETVQIFNMTFNLLMMMWFVSTSIPTLFQSVGIARQALSVMRHPQDVLDTPHAKPLVITEGKIIFDNVSFYYGKKELFRNKNVIIQGGEKVGLVGYSGAGKSTFVNLILRFYPLQNGRILIDNQEISQVTLQSLRQQVALIPQEPVLFHRTIEENIRYGNIHATQAQILEAAQLAHCDEFIKNCPDGYNTLIGERGTKLSGGERQRIAIARAILSNAPILLLDEATSALDSVTEHYIQESIEKLMEKRTSIVIAHRLSTLAKMDRILVFKKGKIVEEGSHEYLLTKGSYYKYLWDMQAGGFLPENPVLKTS